MSRRKAARLAWSIFGLALLLTAVGVALTVANQHVPRGTEDTLFVGLLFTLVNLSSAFVGTLISTRHPRNPVGWMFLGVGSIGAVAGFADSYAVYTLLNRPDSLPGGVAMAWLADSVISSPSILFGTFIFLLLLFPHGRLPSRGWRRMVLPALVTLAALQAFVAFEPGPLPGHPAVRNPLGLGFVGELGAVQGALLVAMLGILVASAVSLVRRFRRSSGETRQQLKWIVAAAAVLTATILTGPLWWAVVPESVSDRVWPVLFALALGALPVACGVAILKHRLYDIDLVINRALVYGALTATLAAAYLGVVLLLQLAFSPLTEDNDLAIAGSTLAVAALFRPARARIQALVDRRFYRRRYDAVRTLEGFGARLRDEVALEAVNAELRSVVRETIQPAHLSLWLRAPRGPA